MALVQFNPNMSRGKKAALLLVIFAAVAGALWLFIGGEVGYVDSLKRRGERDFVVKEYTVGGVWERTVREGGQTLFSYVSFKPAGADFFLSVSGNSNAFNKEQNAERNARLGQIKNGDLIRVKVYAPELAEAQRSNPWLWLKRFVMADSREVEIYRLEKDGAIILPDADIQRSDKLGRQGGKLAALRVLLLVLALGVTLHLAVVAAGKLKARRAVCVFVMVSCSAAATGFAADYLADDEHLRIRWNELFNDKLHARKPLAYQNTSVVEHFIHHYAVVQKEMDEVWDDAKMREEPDTVRPYAEYCLRGAIELYTYNAEFKPALDTRQERLVEQAAFLRLSSKIKYSDHLDRDIAAYVREHFPDAAKILKQAADYDRFRDEMVRLAKAAVAGKAEIPADAPVRIYFDNDNIVVLFQTQLPAGVFGADYHAKVTINAATKKVESILVGS